MASAAKFLPTIEGMAKAGGHWEGADATLDYNFNLASLTDNGAGDFSPQIGNDMASVNYATSSFCETTIDAASNSTANCRTYAAGSVDVNTGSNGTIEDRVDTTFLAVGDLA